MYDDNGFWRKVSGSGVFEIKIVGDYARALVLELASVCPGDCVLDAGCGTGRLARPCALAGARVIACDRDAGMLGVGIDFDTQSPLGVLYIEADICERLPAHNVDTVLCSAALMHNTRRSLHGLIREAWRALRPGGRLVLSVLPHRELLEVGLTGTSTWIRYDTHGASQEDVFAGRAQCVEYYRNAHTDELFVSPVYYHDELFLSDALRNGGFTDVDVRYVTITAEMLRHVGFSSSESDPSVGKRGYIVIQCRKGG